MYSNETKETISSKSNLPSFVHDYQTYLTKKKMKMPTPVILQQKINVFKLYKSALDYGGYQKVCDDNLWKDVFLNATQATSYSTNTAYYTRMAYEKYLLEFENTHKHSPVTVITDLESLWNLCFSNQSMNNNNSESPINFVEEIKMVDEKYFTEEEWLKMDEMLASAVPEIPELSKDIEEWYRRCEELLVHMKKGYQTLNRRLKIIDRALEAKARMSPRGGGDEGTQSSDSSSSPTENNFSFEKTSSNNSEKIVSPKGRGRPPKKNFPKKKQSQQKRNSINDDSYDASPFTPVESRKKTRYRN